MSIDLLYFGSLREALGRDGERIDPPSHVLSVEDLIAWLKEQSEGHAAALGEPVLGAVEGEAAGPKDSVFGAREVALFPPPGAL